MRRGRTDSPPATGDFFFSLLGTGLGFFDFTNESGEDRNASSQS